MMFEEMQRSGQVVTCVISGCLSDLSRSVRSITGISFAMPILSTGPNESRDRRVCKMAPHSCRAMQVATKDGLDKQAVDKAAVFPVPAASIRNVVFGVNRAEGIAAFNNWT